MVEGGDLGRASSSLSKRSSNPARNLSGFGAWLVPFFSRAHCSGKCIPGILVYRVHVSFVAGITVCVSERIWIIRRQSKSTTCLALAYTSVTCPPPHALLPSFSPQGQESPGEGRSTRREWKFAQ